jgi:hypothetical protein
MIATRRTSNRTIGPMTDDDLRQRAPSVFASNAMPGVSERYSFLPTSHVVTGLRDAGWIPVFADEQRIRTAEREGFQKHIIRFRRQNDIKTFNVGDHVTEMVLLNSHDRSSAYQLHAGVFRFACANGMVVADSTFSRISLRHQGFDPGQVIEGSFRILDDVPQIETAVDAMRSRMLDTSERTALAEAALIARYDTLDAAPVSPERILRPKRVADTGHDVWSTFNVIQENMLRGGQKDLYRRNPEKGKRFRRMGEVRGIDESVKLNKALWHLAQRMTGIEIDQKPKDAPLSEQIAALLAQATAILNS